VIRPILAFSVANRYAVILVTLIATAFGAWSLARLPIDAVPDVTNNQVQVNAIAPALTPVEIEKQVTVLIERALASEMGGKAGIDYRPAGCGSRSRRRCPSGSRWCRTSSSPSDGTRG